jgi:sugar lactone lactonase YvrE
MEDLNLLWIVKIYWAKGFSGMTKMLAFIGPILKKFVLSLGTPNWYAEYLYHAERLCSFAFRERGGWLMAFASGMAFYDLESGKTECLHKLRPSNDEVRLNDGRCDRQGRFIVGEYDPQQKGLWPCLSDRKGEGSGNSFRWT